MTLKCEISGLSVRTHGDRSSHVKLLDFSLSDLVLRMALSPNHDLADLAPRTLNLTPR